MNIHHYFMTRLKKILKKFYENPVSLHYSDLEKSLIAHGFIKIFAKGSHVKFKHVDAKSDLVIPIHNNDCKEFYKKWALKFVKSNHLNIHYENID